MQVELSGEIEQAVEEMAKTQGFASVDQFVAEVLRSALHLDRPQPAAPESPLWETLSSSMVGLEEALPADGAREHDHYIYGTPKRSE